MSRFFADRSSPLTGVYYALFNGQSGDGEYKIGAATRTNGVWSEYASNPVLTKGTGWEADLVKDPCLVWDGSQYVVYYAGYSGTVYTIGRATASSHEGTWTKYGSNPVLNVGTAGAFDDAGVSFPTVLYESSDTGKEWKMWYGANDGSTSTIGYAHSTDGLSWTKVGKVLDVGTSGDFDDVDILPGAIYKDGSTYYLFYGGRQNTSDNKWQGGYATFTNPEGTYTKYASNPVLLSRFNDAPFPSGFTSDPSPGQAVVVVSDTSKFNLGEPVVVVDGDTTAENFYVVSKTSTDLTLDHNITGTFTNASSGGVRPFAFISTFPRSVLSRTGGYELFGTPFQPVEDLGQPASKLWEGAFEWRASALTGTWSYYYVEGRGLLFPLSPNGASWHSRSAENPSVIVAP